MSDQWSNNVNYGSDHYTWNPSYPIGTQPYEETVEEIEYNEAGQIVKRTVKTIKRTNRYPYYETWCSSGAS